MPDDNADSNASGDSRSWLDRLASIFNDEPENRRELLALIKSASDNGVLDAETYGIIDGALQIANLRASDIMIPRAQIVTLDLDDCLNDLLSTIIKSGHSRFPVLGEEDDEVMGILLAKDLLPLAQNRDMPKRFNLKDLLRPAFIIPESKHLDSLLHNFRASHNHLAVVVNEYGGIAGLITIEDVLEQIVGDIEDEHDTDESNFAIRNNGNDSYTLNALTPIDTFNEFFGSNLSDGDFDTVGGLVIQQFGRLPDRREQICFNGFCFTIISANGRVIRWLKVSLTDANKD